MGLTQYLTALLFLVEGINQKQVSFLIIEDFSGLCQKMLYRSAGYIHESKYFNNDGFT